MIFISLNYINEPPNFVFMEVLSKAMIFLNGNLRWCKDWVICINKSMGC